jgi:hypothetical protein
MDKDDVNTWTYYVCLFVFLGGTYVSIWENVTPGTLLMAMALLLALSVYSSDTDGE